ncbi:HDOD domain-containing protein [Pseudoduganella namucuonensis]|uniref:HDIG domain-containing protein n=1 Tax=Pseudoduganella namucuonensis TaxID=1035707 RepID=A0A1I7J5M4_9BURK|nr:HDOD domain-containing protein [Pseudoduganella namucuonensis]SFU80468.1 HDIG domain-containing protein [Pseudoduganella namucuonensis]
MPTIDEVIVRVQNLPSLPAVVSELMSAMDQDDVDLNALAGKIALDQALAAKVLRLANSSFYGMPAKVTTIQQAVAVLGLHSTRTLVTACAITGGFAPDPAAKLDLAAFWRHSVATAACARALARHLDQQPDTAFTAGLLHDLGTLVLATGYPDVYREAVRHRRARDCQVAEAEAAVFGFDHAAVGSALAARWKFPPQIQEAVAAHHAWPGAAPPARTLALAIHLANAFAHALDLGGEDDELAPPLSPAAWRAAGLDDAACLQVLGETERLFGDLCRILVH